MSKKYEEKKESGYEFVQKTKDFRKYGVYKILQMPKDWKDYILDPIYKSMIEIENLVVLANKVYVKNYGKSISEMTVDEREEFKKALEERVGYLLKAKREFNVFDTHFEHMMEHIDYFAGERKRLRNMFDGLIKDAEMKGETEVKITVYQHLNDLEYTSAIGSSKMKLGLTAKNKDYWLKLEYEALEEIQKKLAKDQAMLSKLRNYA